MEAGKTGNIRMQNNFDTDSDEEFKKRLSDLENLWYSPDERIKVYFAGPWFDERSAKLYRFCEHIIKMMENSKVKTFFPKNEVNETPKQAFDTNVKKIKECDILIALVSKKDVGTAWEIGMAYALGKEIYLLGYDETTFLSHTNVMLAFTGKCITIDKLCKFCRLQLKDSDFVKIKNEWEGIE